MFQSDNYSSYADGYFESQFNLSDSNGVDCRLDNGSMYQISHTFMEGIYSNNEIRDVKFDPHEELIWCISTSGHLCAYYEYNLTKVVSVEVPELNRRMSDDIYDLLGLLIDSVAINKLVYVLGRDEIMIYKKTGSLHERIKLNPTHQAQCFSHHPHKASSLIIGSTAGIVEYDLETKLPVNELKFSNYTATASAAGNGTGGGSTSLLKYNRGLLCGTDDGQIITIDLRDKIGIQHSFKPHSNNLSDFTVNSEGYAVVSCGTYKCNQQLYTDQFLKVYDLRYKKSQCPIKVEMQPSFVRFMPVFNDSILLASNTGQYQIANFGQNLLGHPKDDALLINEYDMIRAVDISSNSKLIAFGTSGGLISLVSNCCDDLKINNCSIDTTFPVVPPYMSMDCVGYDDPKFIMSSSEFAAEPVDTTRFTKLSSDWPAELCSKRYRKINPVDMNLFSQYQSKFKAELIGRKPANWGPVWFPY